MAMPRDLLDEARAFARLDAFAGAMSDTHGRELRTALERVDQLEVERRQLRVLLWSVCKYANSLEDELELRNREPTFRYVEPGSDDARQLIEKHRARIVDLERGFDA